MNKLTVKVKIFETGSMYASLNRPLTTTNDWREFDSKMSQAYKKWQEKKKNKD